MTNLITDSSLMVKIIVVVIVLSLLFLLVFRCYLFSSIKQIRGGDKEFNKIVELIKNNNQNEEAMNEIDDLLFVCSIPDNARAINYISDNSNKTLLHYAAEYGNYEIAKYLLDIGANPNKRDKNNKTALDYANEHNHTNISDLFLNRSS